MECLRTLGAALLLLVALGPGAGGARALDVVATTPDLGALTRAVGGDAVDVTVLVKGPQDPHAIDPRPSFVRRLHDADLYVEMGMDLEAGWAPVLLRGARNPELLPGGPGYLNASLGIRPLQVPTAGADRSMGDVHLYGNPHYLVDPVNGLVVARTLRDALVRLDPDNAAAFRARHAAFEDALLTRLVGAEGAADPDREGLVEALRRYAPEPLPGGRRPAPGSWLARGASLRGVAAVEDHQYWIYFARRFGLELVATLEPRPGIAPTSGHLAEVVEIADRRDARLVLATPYFDPRHARWVAERTRAEVAPLAHQVGAREGVEDYLALTEHNLQAALDALAAAGASR